jgi:hypothetical protein
MVLLSVLLRLSLLSGLIRYTIIWHGRLNDKPTSQYSIAYSTHTSISVFLSDKSLTQEVPWLVSKHPSAHPPQNTAPSHPLATMPHLPHPPSLSQPSG